MNTRIKSKQLLVSAGLALSMTGFTGSANAGIPVIDLANLAQAVQEIIAWGKQAADMAQQYTQLKQQYTQTVTMTAKLDGARSLGSILNNPAINLALPPEMQNAPLILLSPTATTSNPTAISNMISAFAITVPSGGNAQVNSLADQLLKSQGILQSAQTRGTQITQLGSRIDSSADIKEATDLVARTQLENARITNTLAQQLALQELNRKQDEMRRIAYSQAEDAALKAYQTAYPAFQ